MAIKSMQELSRSIKRVATHAGKFRDMVQELLIACAYYAFKDGNVTPFNQLISAVGNGTHVKGITMWIELAAGIGRVKNGAIVLNKKVRDESGVMDEESFAPFEAEMRKVAWHEIAGTQKVESVFDEAAYIKRVYKKLESEGYGGLAEALKQAELAWFVQNHQPVQDDDLDFTGQAAEAAQ